MSWVLAYLDNPVLTKFLGRLGRGTVIDLVRNVVCSLRKISPLRSAAFQNKNNVPGMRNAAASRNRFPVMDNPQYR